MEVVRKHVGSIFATTLAVLGDLNKNETVNELSFSADKGSGSNDSRSRLYKAMIKRFASKHGFHLAKQGEQMGSIIFTLVRNGWDVR